MSLKINHELSGGDCATVSFSDGQKELEIDASYLHDSLLDLAQLAISLKRGDQTSQAIFVVDPEEIHFLVRIENGMALYELREYDDWASLSKNTKGNYRTLLEGYTSADDISQQITGILSHIFQNIGPEKYHELWPQHEFPLAAFECLEKGPKSIRFAEPDRKKWLREVFWPIPGYLIAAFSFLLFLSFAAGMLNTRKETWVGAIGESLLVMLVSSLGLITLLAFWIAGYKLWVGEPFSGQRFTEANFKIRIALAIVAIFATLKFINLIFVFFFPLAEHPWVGFGIELFIALSAGYFVWSSTKAVCTTAGLFISVILGAVVTGSVCFAVGFYGPVYLWSGSPLDPLLGLFVTGPIGFFAGGIGGLMYWVVKSR